MISAFSAMVRIVLSAILGGLIGTEREVHRHEAGLRTHILVCMGSTLIMLTSIHVFDIYKEIGTVDPSRIASGVITGIGFLGAGAIIRYGMAVKGLTTAASLWITSAVGLAVGCGFYFGAIFSTIIVLVVLLFLRNFERTLLRKEEVEHGIKK
ncbi:MAG: MgtC/SapB family protein [Candidatus Omnitrophica bacterium]|nr:MgtC/SapB family protein [Candidatus Omnitrophota bacterium]MDD5352578.1 MgtC/SapB family protein [Candidatus Omnitrophota bacterium]MDD5550176.1 MgtC/SapB family protein [Candidatus Omnitrophota bacterium]